MDSNNLAEQLLAREAAKLEETKRFNAEREIARALAPQKWDELKRGFEGECAALSRTALRCAFECEQPDAFTFHLNRIVNGVALRAAAFRFEPALPGILFESEHRSDIITFMVDGSRLNYVIGRRGLILKEFVMELILNST